MTKEMVDKLGVSRRSAKLISETEIRRARHAAYCNIGKQLGYTQKIFRSYFGRCPICAALDRKIFPIDEEVIPAQTHPNCRCATFIIPSSRIPPIGSDYLQ